MFLYCRLQQTSNIQLSVWFSQPFPGIYLFSPPPNPGHTHGHRHVDISFRCMYNILLLVWNWNGIDQVTWGFTVIVTLNRKHLCSHVEEELQCYLSTTEYISILEFLSIEHSCLNGIVCVCVWARVYIYLCYLSISLYIYIILWPFKTYLKSIERMGSVIYFCYLDFPG